MSKIQSRKGIRAVMSLAVALAVALPLSAHAATPGQTCESGKNGTAGKYASCLHNAQAKFVKGGEMDPDGRDAAVLRCGTGYSAKWGSIERRAGGACPSTGDASSIQDFLDACIFSAEDALGGGVLPLDVGTCNDNLATCLDAPCEAAGGLPATGQTICYDTSGFVIACAGTGQDGELQRGVASNYTDNGNGTITDNLTGLMWEKQSDDGSIHDKDNTYLWDEAFTTKVATLNNGGVGFAGHTDWRVPNLKELETLKNIGAVDPATSPVFNASCTASCTVLTCSCTQPYDYWSSSTYQGFPTSAWGVWFDNGATNAYSKAYSLHVRAVRAGS